MNSTFKSHFQFAVNMIHYLHETIQWDLASQVLMIASLLGSLYL